MTCYYKGVIFKLVRNNTGPWEEQPSNIISGSPACYPQTSTINAISLVVRPLADLSPRKLQNISNPVSSKWEVTRLRSDTRSTRGAQVLVGDMLGDSAPVQPHVIFDRMRLGNSDSLGPVSNSSGNSLASFVCEIQHAFRTYFSEQHLLDHLFIVDVNGLRISK
ncbi:hypothetical protein EDD85DRAFT_792961 [Armillaria nabsnona]|nr:hypothetical protein EDD85DRAFT_792961 [Armillaria nabsnona]